MNLENMLSGKSQSQKASYIPSTKNIQNTLIHRDRKSNSAYQKLGEE